ncbi:MAG TPA: NAD(P)/FAD-dependent oxidoreductase [Herpetosiphonaceae bacterium]
MYDLIIIGGGPAAVAAAFHAQEKQLDAVMIYEDLGGKVGWRESLVGHDLDQQRHREARWQVQWSTAQVQHTTPYLPANDLVRMLISRAMKSGRVIHDRVLGISPGLSFFSVETQAQGVLQATAILVATGATPLRLNVPGAHRLIDPGMSYSIATYAQQVADQSVAVIGGTTRALLGAAELVWTAARVYLVVPNAEQLANPLAHMLIQQPNVEVFPGYEVVEVSGTQTLRELVLMRGGEIHTITVQHAFVDLGLVPNSEVVRALVKTDAHGFIVVDQHNATSAPGIFAAGDVTTTAAEQVMVAIGDGARAAISAYTYILSRWLATERMARPA